jgi:transposase
LVAAKIDDLNLIDLIDHRLPISEAHGAKVSHGESVAAMIMNGLGFIDSRLYLFPEFFCGMSDQRLVCHMSVIQIDSINSLLIPSLYYLV